MQELNHHPKGEIETEASYLNATSESCQLANPPTPRNPHSKASAELYELHSPAYYTQKGWKCVQCVRAWVGSGCGVWGEGLQMSSVLKV